MNEALGLVVTMTARRERSGYRIDQAALSQLEGGLLQGGRAKKRRGRYIRFCRVPCYELEATLLPEGDTVVVRLFAAFDVRYELRLLGGPDLRKEHPRYASFFEGFQFTRAHEPQPEPEPEESLAYRIGYYMGGLVVILLIVFAIKRLAFGR